MSKWSSAFRDSRWQKLRLKVMERDGWQCRACGNGSGDGVTLNVHHAYYTAGTAPWEYPVDSLVTYCEGCHEIKHALQKSILHASVNRSICAFVGVESLVYRFEKTLEQFGKYNEEIIIPTNSLEENKARAKIIDSEISEYIQKILDKEYGSKGAAK